MIVILDQCCNCKFYDRYKSQCREQGRTGENQSFPEVNRMDLCGKYQCRFIDLKNPYCMHMDSTSGRVYMNGNEFESFGEAWKQRGHIPPAENLNAPATSQVWA